MHYHDLLMDTPIMDHSNIAIRVISNGFWIDDLKFVLADKTITLKICNNNCTLFLNFIFIFYEKNIDLPPNNI